ncbi:sigma-54 interaction domain-containing protein [Idiomarina tyrosinivorans]|nr:sigma-54 dependent transcriptional regulator [Idiomarina tyrosinivorans]
MSHQANAINNKAPGLLLSISTLALKNALLEHPAMQSFNCQQFTSLEQCPQELLNSYQVAIVESVNFDQKTFDKIEHLLQPIEWIFISDGSPNAFLDKAILQGAGQLFRHPVALTELLASVSELQQQLCPSQPQAQPPSQSQLDQFGSLVGSSTVMRELYKTLRRLATTDQNVFIQAESGTGKELAAQTLHAASTRAKQPFIAVNCAALSRELVESELFGHVKGAFTGATQSHQGLFSQAHNGTLFLDEITEMPLEHQAKLLRVLETGDYRPVGSNQLHRADVRIIAASNRDLEQAITQGQLREDLFFRLNQFPLSLPPLREREADIAGLAQHFLAYRNQQQQQQKRFSQAALEHIQQFPWPGNVRQLKHCVERAYLLAEQHIMVEHLLLNEDTALANGDKALAGMPLQQLEKAAIEATLEMNQGNRSKTAEQLGVSVKTLYNKLERYQHEETQSAATETKRPLAK